MLLLLGVRQMVLAVTQRCDVSVLLPVSGQQGPPAAPQAAGRGRHSEIFCRLPLVSSSWLGNGWQNNVSFSQISEIW